MTHQPTPAPGAARQDAIEADHQSNQDITRAACTALDTVADYLTGTPVHTLAPWLLDHGAAFACTVHHLGRDTHPVVARRARRLLANACSWPTHDDDDPRIAVDVEEASTWPRRAQIILLRYAARQP